MLHLLLRQTAPSVGAPEFAGSVDLPCNKDESVRLDEHV